MKKLFVFLSVITLLPISAAFSQILPTDVSSKSQTIASPAKETIATTTKNTSDSTEAQATDEEVKILVPAKLSEEQLAAEDDTLRDNLRNTAKNDDHKSRVKLLEVNNYIDKVTLRRNLQKQGLSFKEASKIAETLPKPKIDPDSNKQMNDYIFDRADVKDQPQPTKADIDVQ